ncbi:hypothetical protein SDRG_12378 [Saprolegnia diclina VS20]|uniref:Uncharacterized protein n=1 Tax=Saprolegnia diclina (strain VS20) TaxID=1156394 RepID=T0RIW7_SAPDV|nr:hypothetical protein SDRG_12378 [Saprolegnia diclina VS20]EQC29832.1 hypothetical protein SDRG_12378 [Saprolegnia diclina VS20]|eukprot:XP_008616671.1 hypothetical protein SDRG_12378 [Saprolegnia diclina VS20]
MGDTVKTIYSRGQVGFFLYLLVLASLGLLLLTLPASPPETFYGPPPASLNTTACDACVLRNASVCHADLGVFSPPMLAVACGERCCCPTRNDVARVGAPYHATGCLPAQRPHQCLCTYELRNAGYGPLSALLGALAIAAGCLWSWYLQCHFCPEPTLVPDAKLHHVVGSQYT